jgi:hypothetical protein
MFNFSPPDLLHYYADHLSSSRPSYLACQAPNYLA